MAIVLHRFEKLIVLFSLIFVDLYKKPLNWKFLIPSGASGIGGTDWQCKHWVVKGNDHKSIKDKNL